MPRKFDLQNAYLQKEKLINLIKQNELKTKVLTNKLQTLDSLIELEKSKNNDEINHLSLNKEKITINNETTVF